MSDFTPQMIISGVPYTVVEIDGHAAPPDLAAVAATGSFTVEGRTGLHTIAGEGTVLGDVVRFHEKTEHGVGKDVRVWEVSRGDDGGLVAVVV